MTLDNQISSLIADIYNGASDTAVWDRAMSQIGDRLNSQFVMFSGVNETDNCLVKTQFYNVRHSRHDEAVIEYSAYTHSIDPTLKHVLLHPQGGVFESTTEIGLSGYSQDSYVRWNEAMMGSMFWTAHHSSEIGKIRFGISLHRSESSGPLRSEESSELALLFEHIKNALNLACRPPLIQSIEPTLLLNSAGDVCRLNDTAREFLTTTAFLSIFKVRLVARHHKSATKLDRVIKSILNGETIEALVRLEQERDVPLLLEVRALPVATFPLPWNCAAALVRVVDTATVPDSRCNLWRSLFGLTPAETRLTKLLLEAHGGLREASAQLGITYGTARVQLASVFQKTDVRTQSQLTRLLTLLK